MRHALWVLFVVLAAAAGADIRAQDRPVLRFDVASVKPNVSNGPDMFAIQPGGRFTATNLPLKTLIANAYLMKSFQIVGAPAWTAAERFDIAAQAGGSPAPTSPAGPPGQLQLMVQTLLAERFQLAAHHETRQLPIYALVVARSDGALGPQLHATTTDCDALMRSAGARGAQPPAPQPGDRPLCGLRVAPGQIVAGSARLAGFAFLNILSQSTQRIVVDQTGLTGTYDFDLIWAPDEGPTATVPPAADQNRPSLFTALQEQLGLKLESRTGPVDVLVIDHVERPTPD